MPKGYVLITGVSTGIGLFCANKFIHEGYVVYGSVRKQQDAEKVTSELGQDFRPLLFDVTKAEQINAAAEKVTAEIGDEGLALLINNSGVAVYGPVAVLDVDDYRYQFEVNVFGLLEVTKAFLPLLGASKHSTLPPGKIMNMSSIAGMRCWPFMSPYSGSKFAVNGISEGLRRELMLYGIDVIVINPGPIKTPIWDKVEEPSAELLASDYAPYVAKFKNAFVAEEKNAMPGDVFANKIFKIFKTKNPKPYNVIMNKKFLKWHVMGLIPRRMMDRLVEKMLKMKP